MAQDALQLARVMLLESPSHVGGLDSAFDLTTFVLQLAPERGTPLHTSALMLRGQTMYLP